MLELQMKHDFIVECSGSFKSIPVDVHLNCVVKITVFKYI